MDEPHIRVEAIAYNTRDLLELINLFIEYRRKFRICCPNGTPPLNVTEEEEHYMEVYVYIEADDDAGRKLVSHSLARDLYDLELSGHCSIEIKEFYQC